MLKLKNISKSFDDTQALDKVSLEIDKNAVVGLLGPNGAGKTTLMRIIVGFLQANKGRIYWQGKKIDSQNTDYKRQIGYLPENNPLYPEMTVAEYLEYCADLKNVTDKKKQLKKVVSECSLQSVTSKKIETLSKGFRQRVGLAAALLGQPKLLILDEPTAGLDPKQIIEIKKLIKKLARTKAVLLSTHILPEARDVCQRLVLLSRGQIVLDKETKKIRNLEKKFLDLT